MPPMAVAGEEPVGSMGNDSPLAVLSSKDKTLYHYFKQLFAQVTNPAIDPIREELVMSLVSFIGPKPNLLGIDELNPPLRLEVSQPVLDFYEMEKIRHIERYTGGKFKSCELDITYPVAWGKEAIEARLASLAAQAEDAVRSGYSIIVISDRLVDRERVAIPALLALSAIHQHLVGQGAAHLAPAWWSRPAARARCITSRCSAATAPRRCIRISRSRRCSRCTATDQRRGTKAIKNYVKAIGKGLKKVMSKMGISTYMSYTGAQIFEAVGLAQSLVDKYFTGTASNVEGIGLFEVAEEAMRIHQRRVRRERSGARAGARRRRRVRLARARRGPHVDARRDRQAAAFDARQLVLDLQGIRGAHQRPVAAAHDVPRPVRVPLRRAARRCRSRRSSRRPRSSSASPPARCRSARSRPRRTPTLAIAMNRIGGKSNTGEGGEDRKRYAPVKAGETLQSRLGQEPRRGRHPAATRATRSSPRSSRSPRAASASPRNTSPAREMLQIKIAQGAKPGEGGQLPGRKVSEYIAELRYSTPGVELISPPPHHDIYSIEDIAQLIHDLKNANPQAAVSREARVRGRRRHGRGGRVQGASPTTSRSPATTAAPAPRPGPRSSTPARRGSWGSPRRSRRWC